MERKAVDESVIGQRYKMIRVHRPGSDGLFDHVATVTVEALYYGENKDGPAIGYCVKYNDAEPQA